MARISWDKIAERYFEIGVSRGVFFLKLEKELEEIEPYYERSKKVKSYIDYSMENGITGDPESIPDEQGWVILDGEEDPDSGNTNTPSANDDEEEDEDISEYYPGVAWNGLSSVEIQPDGADPNAIWSGDVKYGDLRSPECLAGTISALSFPTQFRLCDGTGIPTDGLYIGQQTRREFGFCYRTELLSDMNPEHGYLLHVVYNCTVGPSEKEYVSVSESEDALLYTWEFKATPVELDGYLPFNEIVFDSTKIPADKMQELENCLYGTSETLSTLPSPKKLVGIIGGEPYYPWDSGDLPYDTMKITENGIYDVREYKHADVEVSSGGGDDLVRKLIERAPTSIITNNASVVGDYAFYLFPNLLNVNFPACTTIGSSAFYRCSTLTSANFPACTTIGRYAFYSCYALTSVNFPVCTTIESSAFYTCHALTSANFPACTTIETDAFRSCHALTSANFPACTTIVGWGFEDCSALTDVSFPVCSTIGVWAFCDCQTLTSASFPVCTTIKYAAFYGCYRLATIRFPVCTTIASSAFCRCYNLLNLYLLSTSVVSLLNNNAFLSTPISDYTTSTGGVHGSVFVRASLLAQYQADSVWSWYADRLVGLTDEEIAALPS